jgi:hypothetical protein
MSAHIPETKRKAAIPFPDALAELGVFASGIRRILVVPDATARD